MSPPHKHARVIVVADAHLGQVPAAVGRAFHAFLEEIPQPGDHLVLTGDLFDFWFEYRSVIPRKHFATVTRLQEVRARGIPITFVGGNHDRWGGTFFTEDLGIQFFAGEVELELAGRTVFIAHTQRPMVDRRPDGRTLLNPGAFLDGGRYAVITADAVELKQFTTERLPPA